MNEYFPSVLASPVPIQHRLTLTAGEHSARHVRRVARGHLEDWDLHHLTEAVQLALTELIANVVRHVPDRRCEVLIRKRESGVRVEVRDGDNRLPRAAAEPDPTSESGRGLFLVAAVTNTWGVSPMPGGGKTVWFECLPEEPPPCAAPVR
ncbi:ATP-binding protein [Streptomyces sp. NPDC088812]|uniref:ATP-binding protein n=1 Tax=Streptomyces sp. NPDC088812 TaxID=3365905 RepID=UPI00382A10A6